MHASTKGFTLIETLVTVVFIAFSILALIRFQSFLAYDNMLSQQRADAIVLAERQIEILKDYHVVATTSGLTAYQDIVSGSQNVTGMTTQYTVTWTVTTNSSPDYKNISVTVSWTDKNNVARSVNLTTRIAEVEPSNSSTIM